VNTIVIEDSLLAELAKEGVSDIMVSDAIIASLEPMLIMMVLGVIIGTIVIAMYFLIFGMADAIW